MIALGVDPGLTGAVAAACSRRGLLDVASLPTMPNGAGPDATVRKKVDARALSALLTAWSTRHAFHGEHVIGAVERMLALPPNPAGGRRQANPTALLSMGHSAGACEAVLVHFCHGVLTPTPQQWKRTYGLAGVKDGAKADAVEVARRLFVSTPSRFRHDLAEAALIAHWALGSVNGPAVAPATTEECAFP